MATAIMSGIGLGESLGFGIYNIIAGGPPEYDTEVAPNLRNQVALTQSPAFALWYGEVKGFTENSQPVIIGSAKSVPEYEQVIQNYSDSRGIVVYALDCGDQPGVCQSFKQFNPKIPVSTSLTKSIQSNMGIVLIAGFAIVIVLLVKK